MKIKSKNSPVIIIGMHRSGTSMLTRFLEESGVFMGRQDRMDSNQEAIFFQQINEWILSQKGVTWDNLGNLKFNSQFTNEHIVENIETHLSSFSAIKFLGFKKYFKFKDIRNIDIPWGWKDPRNTLTLEIWKEIFPEAKIVHIYRNPIDVAESLKARELEIEKNFIKSEYVLYNERKLLNKPTYNLSTRIKNLKEGISLWEEYMEIALKADLIFDKVMHISFEKFTQNPDKTLEQLARFTEVKIDKAIIDSICSKVDKSKIYSFINNKILIEEYNKIRNNELMKRLDYSEIKLSK